MRSFKKTILFTGCFFVVLLNLPFAGGIKDVAAANIRFKVIAVNPSETKTQTVKIKKYLLEEVLPRDIVDLGTLELEYDADKALYYVYKEDVVLAPKEVRAYEIEVKDVWVVPEEELAAFQERSDGVMKHLEGTPYYDKGRQIAGVIKNSLEEIRSSQSREDVSRQQHIGIYRQNLIIISEIKKNLAQLEKILVAAGGPPAPDMLADTAIKSDSPSKTMTWIVVFSIIVFSGLLAGVLFFTWHQQARVTKETLLGAKKTSFPSGEEEKEK